MTACISEAILSCASGSPVVVIPLRNHKRLQRPSQALHAELSGTELRAAETAPQQAASLDRLVAYSVENATRSERRPLIDPADGMWSPTELSVITPLGVTLPGLSVGDRMSIIGTHVLQPPWLEVAATGPMTTSGMGRG